MKKLIALKKAELELLEDFGLKDALDNKSLDYQIIDKTDSNWHYTEGEFIEIVKKGEESVLVDCKYKIKDKHVVNSEIHLSGASYSLDKEYIALKIYNICEYGSSIYIYILSAKSCMGVK